MVFHHRFYLFFLRTYLQASKRMYKLHTNIRTLKTSHRVQMKHDALYQLAFPSIHPFFFFFSFVIMWESITRRYNKCYRDNHFSHIMYHIMHFLHASSGSFHRNLLIINMLCEFLNAKSLCGLDGDYYDSHHFPNNVCVAEPLMETCLL